MNYAGYAVATHDLLCNQEVRGTLHSVPGDLKPTNICKINLNRITNHLFMYSCIVLYFWLFVLSRKYDFHLIKDHILL